MPICERCVTGFDTPTACPKCGRAYNQIGSSVDGVESSGAFGKLVTITIVGLCIFAGYYYLGADPIVGRWGPSANSPEYFEFGRFGGLKQYQQVFFQSGRVEWVTTEGSWERNGDKIRLKITKANPADIKVPDADMQLVSVSSSELTFRKMSGGIGKLVPVTHLNPRQDK